MTTNNLATLHDEAVAALRKALKAPETGRSPILRDLATIFLDARSLFYLRDGSPDILGRSYAYRSWVREVYADAGVPRDRVTTIQGTVRYHTGNILRERMSPEELADLGLLTTTPRERVATDRSTRSGILSLVNGGGPVSSSEDVLELLRIVEHALARVVLEDAGQAARVEKALAEVRTLLETLRV